MSQHTPGPWRGNKDGKVYSQSVTEWNRTANAESAAFIAAVGGQNYLANTRLIAAAPEMLQLIRDEVALFEAYGLDNPLGADEQNFLAVARALLARIEGDIQ